MYLNICIQIHKIQKKSVQRVVCFTFVAVGLVYGAPRSYFFFSYWVPRETSVRLAMRVFHHLKLNCMHLSLILARDS